MKKRSAREGKTRLPEPEVGLLRCMCALAGCVASHYWRVIRLRYDGMGLRFESVGSYLAFIGPALLMGVVARGDSVNAGEVIALGLFGGFAALVVFGRQVAVCLVVATFVVDACAWAVSAVTGSVVFSGTNALLWTKAVYALVLVASFLRHDFLLFRAEEARAEASKRRAERRRKNVNNVARTTQQSPKDESTHDGGRQ